MQTPSNLYEAQQMLKERSALLVLGMLLCADLGFMILHVITYKVPQWGYMLLDIEQDQSYPEAFQYLKFFWIVVLLAVIAVKDKAVHYLAWICMFSYLLIDDALQMHELIGKHLVAYFNFMPRFRLRPQDFGELLASAMAGILCLTLLAWAYRKGTWLFRKLSQDLALLFLALVFFGIGVDMLHIAFNVSPAVKFTLGLIEDGGEMLAASLLLWYAFLMTLHRHHYVSFLCDWLKLAIRRRYAETNAVVPS